MARRCHTGFTLVELVVSMAVTSVVMATVFALVAPAGHAFSAQPEAADVQQRVRLAVGLLMQDLLGAGAGVPPGDGCTAAMGAPIRPYRIGQIGSDPAAGIHHRPDVVTIASAAEPLDPSSAIVTRTYHLKAIASDSSQLMRYDGRETDHPVLEDVVMLAFDYFGVPPPEPPSSASAPVLLDPALLIDGPWCPDAGAAEAFDADLIRIRRVAVRLRVQAPRAFRGASRSLFLHPGDASGPSSVPDQEVRFDVAPRNLNRDR